MRETVLTVSLFPLLGVVLQEQPVAHDDRQVRRVSSYLDQRSQR